MPNVFDVARYILHKKGPMSTWKLQKLCYYAQAWSLVWDDAPIFNSRIEAWANGPVCPPLFQVHKGAYMIGERQLSIGKLDAFSQNQRDTLNAIIEFYGDKEGHYLRELTHKERPWKQARENTPEGENSNAEITHISMKQYYGSL